LEKANGEIAKEVAKFDREDVQLQEKKKHKLQKQKKLQKAAQSVYLTIDIANNRANILMPKLLLGFPTTPMK